MLRTHPSATRPWERINDNGSEASEAGSEGGLEADFEYDGATEQWLETATAVLDATPYLRGVVESVSASYPQDHDKIMTLDIDTDIASYLQNVVTSSRGQPSSFTTISSQLLLRHERG